MMQSEQINELATALSKAQGQIDAASKSKANSHLRSSYSTLMDYWDACREPLSKNGLAVVQTTSHQDDGRLQLETTLMHASGQWIRGVLALLPGAKNDVQGYGSLMTYMRRYALAAMIGIAPDEDTEDDGEKAKGGNANPAKAPPSKQSYFSEKASDKKVEEPAVAKADYEDIKKLGILMTKVDPSLKKDTENFINSLKLPSSNDLSQKMCLKLIERLEESLKQKPEEEVPF